MTDTSPGHARAAARNRPFLRRGAPWGAGDCMVADYKAARHDSTDMLAADLIVPYLPPGRTHRQKADSRAGLLLR